MLYIKYRTRLGEKKDEGECMKDEEEGSITLFFLNQNQTAKTVTLIFLSSSCPLLSHYYWLFSECEIMS